MVLLGKAEDHHSGSIKAALLAKYIRSSEVARSLRACPIRSGRRGRMSTPVEFKDLPLSPAKTLLDVFLERGSRVLARWRR